jgi:tryptophan synthase alpha chain
MTATATGTGQSRMHEAFARARAERRTAVLPFITGCYPDAAATERLLRELPAAGADLIEIGIPFSDPIADGPVIAESMHRALVAGATPAAVFEAVRRASPSVPVVAMVSVSIVERMGRDRFLRDAVDAGFSGFIVPDADPASAAEIAASCASLGAGFCPLVAPTTSGERLRSLALAASGFVYLLARAGVTGERTEAPEIEASARRLREALATRPAGAPAIPIAAGFGIASGDHVRAVGAHADGAIVGSAIVRRMTDAIAAGADPVAAALELVRGLRG